MQTKFKDIAQYYLGTGLEFKVDISGFVNVHELTFYNISMVLENIRVFDNVKPLLRSLDSLTKPIKVKGYNYENSFVPAIEIAKLCDNGHNHTDSKVKEYKNLIVIRTDKCDDVENISVRFIDNEIASINRGNKNVTFITYQKITKLLLSWHFNIFGLEETEYIKID